MRYNMTIGMNIDNIQDCVDKMQMYNSDEKENLDNIIKVLHTINENYTTDNSSKFLQIQEALKQKFDVIKLNNYNNEVILINSIQNEINLKNKTIEGLNNI